MLILNETRRPGVHPPAPAVGFLAWQTIKLGTHKTPIELVKAAANAGHLIVGGALDLMAQSTFPLAQETAIDLVSVSAGELGFTSRTPCGWIYERARQLGLRLCPPEVGPQLLLQHHRGQIDGVLLTIAMRPITGSDGSPVTFALMDGDEENRWLVWHSISPAALCPPTLPFVFVLPRQYGPARRAFAAVRQFGRH